MGQGGWWSKQSTPLTSPTPGYLRCAAAVVGVVPSVTVKRRSSDEPFT